MMQEPYVKRPLSGPVRLPSAPPQPYHSEEAIFIRRRREQDDTGRADGFSPVHVSYDAGSEVYTLKIEPSVAQEVIPKSGVDCVENHPVYYNGLVLTRDTEIEVPKAYTLVCKVKQDEEGRVVAGPLDGPELQVLAAVPTSSHWYPADPQGAGAEGTMYFPLYQMDRVDGVEDITFYHWGPIVVRNDLWIGENIGAGVGVLKEHTETLGAYYKFRSIHARYALAHNLSDDILLDFLGENIGTASVGAGAEVYKEQGGGNTDVKAGFRRLSQGPSLRQEISVVENGDIIQIYGNGMSFTLTLDNCDGTYATMVWTDGLLSSVQDESSSDITSFTHYGECAGTPAP